MDANKFISKQARHSPLQVICASCKTENRVDPDRAREATPVCGQCGKPLEPFASGFPLTVTTASFEEDVARAGVPVIVDFWAEWCGPCRMLHPVFEQLAREMAGRVRFARVNVDQEPMLAQKFGVRSIPQMILFRGVEVGRLSGARPARDIRDFLEHYVEAVR